jgi:hypothetical protein
LRTGVAATQFWLTPYGEGKRPKFRNYAARSLDACGSRATLDRSLLGLFYELLEAGVFANLFIYSVLIAFAHVSRAKHHNAK